MVAFNPYAPPQALPSGFQGGFTSQPQGWQLDGDRLVVQKGAVLPPLCVWTGAPTAGMRIQRKLVWMPPWTAIFAISPIIYLALYFILRKTRPPDIALSHAARKRRPHPIFLRLGGAP